MVQAFITFSEVTGDEASERGAVSFNERERAVSGFGQIRRMNLNDDSGKWIVDLLEANNDIVDTIIVQDHHADFLINTFFGRGHVL